MKHYDVIVIGGGMVGAATACALAQANFHVAVIERAESKALTPDMAFDLRVSAISRASENLLRNLGVWQSIVDFRASPYQGMQVWDARGDGRICFDAYAHGQPNLGHIIENSVIQSCLTEKAQQDDNVDWYAPINWQQFQRDAQAIRVTLESGETLSAKLLIGADGRGSRVREQAQIGHQARLYRQKGLVALIQTEEAHQATAWQRFLPGGPLAFLPLADGRSSIVWSLPEQDAAQLLALENDQFEQALAAAFDFTLGDVRLDSRRAAFPLSGLLAEQFVQPRLALIGDAAHGVHPLAGQGVNLGFADVASLVECLKQARGDIGHYANLRPYQRARFGDAWRMIKTTEGLNTLFQQSSPFVQQLRNVGLNFTNRIAPLKQFYLDQALGVNADSPLLLRD